MGIVRMGPPRELITQLKTLCDIDVFVETGTYYGGTAYWASQIFDQVFTIELSKELYQQTSAKYENIESINFLFGDTRDRLAELVPTLETPASFWLDAHWSGGATYGETDQCPLLEEIAIINQSTQDHFIFIDDARLFTSPPPPPQVVEHWPDIVTLLNALTIQKNRYVVIIEDVVVAVPVSAKPILVKYCQKVNAQAWKDYGKRNYLLETRIGKFITWVYKLVTLH